MNSDQHFKKGFLLGSLVGGALVALGFSKKGKEWQAKVAEHSQELYKELRSKVLELGEGSREVYVEMVRRATDEFAKRKELAREAKDMLVSKLHDKWDELQAEVLFKKVKQRFGQVGEKSKEEFEKIIHEIVDQFEEKKDLAGYMKYRLVRDLRKRWEEIKDTEPKDQKEGWL
jgi:gas vesicle protein